MVNEYEFNNLFTKKVNDGVEKKLYPESVSLMETYMNVIESKNVFSIEQTTLPKVLLWNEKMIADEKKSFEAYKAGKKNSAYKNFWDWHYFQTTAFKKIVSLIITKGHTYLLFDTFTKYIEEKCELINMEGTPNLAHLF